MQKRDRLDELINAAFQGRSADDALRALAETCFRHGVERRQSVCRINSIEDVQPGPAEEKCPDCGHSKHEGCGCAICGSRSVKPFCIDRRKGERRKDHYTAYATVDLTGDRLFSTGMAWKLDRRGGNDRRKK